MIPICYSIFAKMWAIVSISNVQLCELCLFLHYTNRLYTILCIFTPKFSSITCQMSDNMQSKWEISHGLAKWIEYKRRCIQMFEIWLCIEINPNNISININIFPWHYFSNRCHYSHMMQLSSAVIHLNVDANPLMSIAQHSPMINHSIPSHSSSAIDASAQRDA